MRDTHPNAHFRLKVAGMSCASCAKHVEEALLTVGGVRRVSVDLESGSAMVGGDEIDPRDLSEAVSRTGYTPSAAEAAEAPCHATRPGSES